MERGGRGSGSPGKIRVAVLYGGRSGEHEVSLVSAASVISRLDRDRFEVIPVGIDKTGSWHLNSLSLIDQKKALPVFQSSLPVSLSGLSLVPVGGGSSQPFDVVFPVMHGTFGEDGTIQGLLELANVPYVGCGVLSSAVVMDKDVSKRLLRESGLPVVPSLVVRAFEWVESREAIEARVSSTLGYPCFVKPANLGSSVGIHKVKNEKALAGAVQDAFRYDEKIVIEKAVEAREIETAVLEAPNWGDDPLVSVPSEIIPRHEFYSYEAKYIDENGASLIIPANLNASQVSEAQSLARRVFLTLECEGMARVDFFLEKTTGKFYVNEANTIPGFTSISMYPKMWEASGLPYSQLLTRLIELALKRHERRSKLVRDFHAGS